MKLASIFHNVEHGKNCAQNKNLEAMVYQKGETGSGFSIVIRK